MSEALPAILPVFPLTGMLLLPGMRLPLHVFEPRYKNMVEDALSGDKYIGMIQPMVPRQDNAPGPNPVPDRPELYPVGCVGEIEEYRKLEDGRYLLTLMGMTRFKFSEELPLLRGYRRVLAEYGGFAGDESESLESLDNRALLESLKAYGDQYSVAFDVNRLNGLPSALLVNGLAMSLPFRPAEKQALLEAHTLLDRQKLVLSLMGMGLAAGSKEGFYTPPTLN